MPIYITIQTPEAITSPPLTLWPIAINLPPDEASFGLDDDEAVWSVSLPGDTSLAEKTLVRHRNIIAQRRQAIGVAGYYLQVIDVPDNEELAFAFGPVDKTEEEETLLTTMATFSQLGEAESLAFDWLTSWRKPIANWEETLDEYRQFMAQAAYLLKPTLRIETTVEQVRLAETLVRANGALETVWRRRVESTQLALHRQTVQLTLETRQSLAFFVAQVSAGAASLAAKFYVAQWVALPAAFRFARDVIHRAKEDQLLARLKALPERT
ncbi:MAG: hypothetical protein H6632_09715 [Anaerolineales bacterium]|nr:hypothetical protein [Anaerolineales bacterium]